MWYRVKLDAIIASRWYIIYIASYKPMSCCRFMVFLQCLILMASVIVHSQVCHIYWEDSNRSHQDQAMEDINEARTGACYSLAGTHICIKVDCTTCTSLVFLQFIYIKSHSLALVGMTWLSKI